MPDKLSTSTEPFFSAEHTREHLANERTFLAWVRTGLGIIGLGFVVVKFSLFIRELASVVLDTKITQGPAYSLPVGIILIVVGVVCIIAAYFRYKRLQRQISQKKFEQSDKMIKVVTVLLTAACVLLIIYLITTTD